MVSSKRGILAALLACGISHTLLQPVYAQVDQPMLDETLDETLGEAIDEVLGDAPALPVHP